MSTRPELTGVRGGRGGGHVGRGGGRGGRVGPRQRGPPRAQTRLRTEPYVVIVPEGRLDAGTG